MQVAYGMSYHRNIRFSQFNRQSFDLLDRPSFNLSTNRWYNAYDYGKDGMDIKDKIY